MLICTQYLRVYSEVSECFSSTKHCSEERHDIRVCLWSGEKKNVCGLLDDINDIFLYIKFKKKKKIAYIFQNNYCNYLISVSGETCQPWEEYKKKKKRNEKK